MFSALSLIMIVCRNVVEPLCTFQFFSYIHSSIFKSIPWLDPSRGICPWSLQGSRQTQEGSWRRHFRIFRRYVGMHFVRPIVFLPVSSKDEHERSYMFNHFVEMM